MEFANQRLKEKILGYINERYKQPSDIIPIDDVIMHIRTKHHEFQRQAEKAVTKQVRW